MKPKKIELTGRLGRKDAADGHKMQSYRADRLGLTAGDGDTAPAEAQEPPAAQENAAMSASSCAAEPPVQSVAQPQATPQAAEPAAMNAAQPQTPSPKDPAVRPGNILQVPPELQGLDMHFELPHKAGGDAEISAPESPAPVTAPARPSQRPRAATPQSPRSTPRAAAAPKDMLERLITRKDKLAEKKGILSRPRVAIPVVAGLVLILIIAAVSQTRPHGTPSSASANPVVDSPTNAIAKVPASTAEPRLKDPAPKAVARPSKVFKKIGASRQAAIDELNQRAEGFVVFAQESLGRVVVVTEMLATPTPAAKPVAIQPAAVRFREPPSGFRLRGVVNTPEGAKANINDRVYKVGSGVNGAKIVAINTFSVEMELDGAHFILGIGDDSDTPTDSESSNTNETAKPDKGEKAAKPRSDEDKPAKLDKKADTSTEESAADTPAEKPKKKKSSFVAPTPTPADETGD